jgi:hypothetical protein
MCLALMSNYLGGTFQGKKILIFCDNEASVKVINSGSSKDAFMQDCLRELCYMAEWTRGK